MEQDEAHKVSPDYVVIDKEFNPLDVIEVVTDASKTIGDSGIDYASKLRMEQEMAEVVLLCCDVIKRSLKRMIAEEEEAEANE